MTSQFSEMGTSVLTNDIRMSPLLEPSYEARSETTRAVFLGHLSFGLPITFLIIKLNILIDLSNMLWHGARRHGLRPAVTSTTERSMNEEHPIPAHGERGESEFTVEMSRRDRPLNTEVYTVEDELRVEVATEMDDGTLDVTTYRFFKIRNEPTAIPKREIDPKFRLVVAAALREHGYELALD